jgi:UDPglucose 6-dehydrogenase
LSEIVKEARGKLIFSTNVERAIDEAQIIFISVNTPTKTYGKGKGMAADRNISNYARQIAKIAKDDKIVVENLRQYEQLRPLKHFDSTGNGVQFRLFQSRILAEGTAVQDLLTQIE